MNVKKILVWLILGLAVLYVVQSPDHAAQVVRGAAAGLADAASSLASFVGSLF